MPFLLDIIRIKPKDQPLAGMCHQEVGNLLHGELIMFSHVSEVIHHLVLREDGGLSATATVLQFGNDDGRVALTMKEVDVRSDIAAVLQYGDGLELLLKIQSQTVAEIGVALLRWLEKDRPNQAAE
jgi:hypothetical protein